MNFVPIFAPHLYAASFEDGTDEFNSFIEFAIDAIQLEQYFHENGDLLEYLNISIDEAVLQTAEMAEQLYDFLEVNRNNLNEVFIHLQENKPMNLLPQMKYKRNWLRLYAVNVDPGYFVITGGAIKQSLYMDDHPDTAKELRKLDQIRQYLLEQGISDHLGFFELINE